MQLVAALAFLFLLNGSFSGQTLKLRPPTSQETQATKDEAPPPVVPPPPLTPPMSVAIRTPIKVALDSEMRVRQVGQPIQGKTTEPVYAFDKLLIPVGTTVN